MTAAAAAWITIARKVVKEAKKANRRLHKARIPVRRAITPKKRATR